MIEYQARALKGMMLAHNRGLTNLNMARVARDLEWAWDTYTTYENALGPFKDAVHKTLNEVEEMFIDFNFDKVRYKEDEITRALDALHRPEIEAVMGASE